MKIYQISNSGQKTEKKELYAEFAGLSKAAGCENLCRFTIDEFSVRTEYEKLNELALMHINDASPVLENISNDNDFIKASRLALMTELYVRVLPVQGIRKIYERAADSAIEKL